MSCAYFRRVLESGAVLTSADRSVRQLPNHFLCIGIAGAAELLVGEWGLLNSVSAVYGPHVRTSQFKFYFRMSVSSRAECFNLL